MTIARLALRLAGVLIFACRITKHRKGFLVMSAPFVLKLERRYIRWCGAQGRTGFGHAVASFAVTAGCAMMAAIKLGIDMPKPCESVAATLSPSSHALGWVCCTDK